ncbi:MAG: hypothetical protein QN163_02725 [Armatimonadota bacterium]|nr:hypothetical protein [Armatimonadota bacterium]MDR5698130.1 hypothetical protein [Armatimonadota bacterium]
MNRKAWVQVSYAVLIIALVLPASAAVAQDDPAILPVDAIRPGMRGVGRTVIRGTRIEEFPFEVLGVTQGPPGKLVLFRAGGEVIRRSGGTAAGMSGSPMYIGGRMAGALSYGYVFAGPDSDLGLFTPIEAMLAVLRGGRGAGRPSGVVALDRPQRIGGRVVHAIALTASAEEAQRIEAGRGPVAAMAPVAVPLLVSGASPRAFRMLEETLRSANVVPIQSYGGTRTFPEAPLVPGSAVGVALVRGDLTVASIGTLSYRRGREFLAFGHPMFGFGESDYMLTTAYVHTVVRAQRLPFKEGDIGSVVGVVSQDRIAAIGGEVGRLPRVFNVMVTVNDQETGRRVELSAQMIRREDLAQLLAPQVALAALDRAWDAVGAGTAEVKLTLRGGGLPRPVERTNLFYSGRDVAVASVLDIPDAIRLLFNNEYAPIRATDLRVEVTLTRRRVTATIAEAQVESRTVPQGGQLRVRLRVRPYQEEDQLSRVVEVAIPRNFPKGPTLLVVSGAGSMRDDVPPDVQFVQKLRSEPPASPFDKLDDALRFFQEFGRNTDILIQLIPFGVPPSDDPTKRFIYFDQFAGRLVRTPWVVKGEVVIPIVVD